MLNVYVKRLPNLLGLEAAVARLRYCGIIVVRGELMFVDFVVISTHEFMCPQTFIFLSKFLNIFFYHLKQSLGKPVI